MTAIVRRGVVAVIRESDRLLIIRRSLTVAAPGLLCFPGGGIEGQESEPEALQREMEEELGVMGVEPLGRLWEYVSPYGVHLAWWHARLPTGYVLRPNPAEVAEVHWMLPSEVRGRTDGIVSNEPFFEAWDQGIFHLPT